MRPVLPLALALLPVALLLSLALPARAENPVVRFTTPVGAFDLELCQETSAKCAGAAPNTVARFLDTLDSGAYEDSFVHRSVAGFVIQGGSYAFDTALSQVCPAPCETLDNEFNQSNVRGSVSVPLSAGNPDSGSTGWFVNVSNNASLDASFFTVFAHVLGDGMSVVDEINGLFRLSIGLTSPPGGTPMTPDFVCNPDQQGACQTPPSPYLVFTEITRVPAPGAPAAGLASVLALAALARRRARAR